MPLTTFYLRMVVGWKYFLRLSHLYWTLFSAATLEWAIFRTSECSLIVAILTPRKKFPEKYTVFPVNNPFPTFFSIIFLDKIVA